MKYKYLFIRLISVCFFLSMFTPPAGAETMYVGFFKNPPHTFISSGMKENGAAITYFKRIAAQMGIADIRFSQLPLPRLLRQLEHNKLDAAVVLAKNAERALKFVYPESPFYHAQSAVVVKKDNPLTQVKGLEDLLKLKIGIYQSSYRSPMMKDERLKIMPVNGIEVVPKSCKDMIIKGRIDAFYTPDTDNLKYNWLIKNDTENDFRILSLPGEKTAIFTAFSKAGGEKYLKKYEAALKLVLKKRTYSEELKEFLKTLEN